jgi:hypothetical protein
VHSVFFMSSQASIGNPNNVAHCENINMKNPTAPATKGLKPLIAKISQKKFFFSLHPPFFLGCVEKRFKKIERAI